MQRSVLLAWRRDVAAASSLLDWVGFIFPPLLLMIRKRLPAEGEAPVKVSTVMVASIWRRLVELKCV